MRHRVSFKSRLHLTLLRGMCSFSGRFVLIPSSQARDSSGISLSVRINVPTHIPTGNPNPYNFCMCHFVILISSCYPTLLREKQCISGDITRACNARVSSPAPSFLSASRPMLHNSIGNPISSRLPKDPSQPGPADSVAATSDRQHTFAAEIFHCLMFSSARV